MEELASHGYAVFSIGHTFESLVELFPDGRQIHYSPKDNIDTSISKLRQELEEIKAGDLAATITVLKNSTRQRPSAASSFGRQTHGSSSIGWKKMNIEDPGSPFYRRLDLNKLGVFGMSFGGSTACQLAFEDRRVKAAANMDGGLPIGDLIDRSLDISFMFMNSEPTTALQGVNQSLIEYMMGRSNTLSIALRSGDRGITTLWIFPYSHPF